MILSELGNLKETSCLPVLAGITILFEKRAPRHRLQP